MLMSRDNLSHADIIASETEDEKDKRAGQSVVRITPSKGAKVRKV